MHWNNLLYFDKFFPMGLRSAAYCCQRVTDAIAFVHHSRGFWSLNYLDDFGSAELQHIAWASFWTLGEILHDAGIQEAKNKVCTPSTRMEFLGNIFDTVSMTIEISDDRMKEILAELDKWLVREHATRKQLESTNRKAKFCRKLHTSWSHLYQ